MSRALAVSVVVVAYRRPELVERCLRSVYAQNTALPIEVLVVDNYGADDTAQMVHEEFPEAVVLEPGENLGFARACNLAASVAQGDRILLVNPDAELRPGCIDALVAFDTANPEVGVLGGRAEHPDGSLDPSTCWGERTLWSLVCYATGLSALFKDHPLFDPESLGPWQRDSPREVGVVSGCLLLARQSVWHDLGGFDERFFMYAEDADLSWRARRLGYSPSITPDAVIIHHLGASSSSESDRIVMRNKGVTTYMRKRWHGMTLRTGLGLFLAGTALRAIGYTAAASLRRTVGPTRDMWRSVWKRRAEWLEGYPEPNAG